jgi:ribosomal protein S18 acetylase RimI-like enzyme
VRQLRRGEIRSAARLLARAFEADPFIGYFLSDPRRRRFALPAFFAAVLHELIESDAVYACECNHRLAGVAAWLPAAPATPSRGAHRRVRLASTWVRLLFPRAAPLVWSGFETLGHDHPEDAHWYLAFIGIEPGRQRRGLGRRLLAPTLERADRDGCLCYLETPFPDTRAFYRRLGFEDTAELEPIAGAPTIWTMTRQANPTVPAA